MPRRFQQKAARSNCNAAIIVILVLLSIALVIIALVVIFVAIAVVLPLIAGVMGGNEMPLSRNSQRL